jgi:very-short-patch-repair endonuclease
VPIPPFIVDFACLSHGLIIELDGATHGDSDEVKYDEKRTPFLNEKGFVVHLVKNIEVYENLMGVLGGILILLKSQKVKP